MYDYQYQVVLQLQQGGNPYNVQLVYPPQSLFTEPNQATRYQNYVPYLKMYTAVAAHESGSVVMNNDPSKGAIDGTLKLFGTRNCFEASSAITPVMNAGNTGCLEQAIGLHAGSLIPTVALL